MDFLTHPIFAGFTALDFVVAAYAVLVMPVISIQGGRVLARQSWNDPHTARYLRIISRGAAAAAFLIAVWWLQDRPFGALGVAPHLSMWDYAGFALALLPFLLAFAQASRMSKLPDDAIGKAMEAARRLKITPNTGVEFVLFLLVGMNAGVWEELVYRGFLIWFLLPLMSLAGLAPFAASAGAAVTASVIFGLGHIYQGWRGVLLTGTIGLAFAVAYLFTHSLWGLMAVHAAMDMAAGVNTFALKRVAARRALA